MPEISLMDICFGGPHPPSIRHLHHHPSSSSSPLLTPLPYSALSHLRLAFRSAPEMCISSTSSQIYCVLKERVSYNT